MKVFISCFLVYCSFAHAQDQLLDTLFAVQIDTADYRFESTIEQYKTSENWMIWSYSLEDKLDSTVNLKQQTKSLKYHVQHISDQDLNTAWIKNEQSAIKSIEFEFSYKPGANFYASAYEFFGQINLFNGNCSSPETWQETGRVKSLKVYFNHSPICFVQLADTWHFQYFSIERFFKNHYWKKYLSAPFEIKTGDRLTFEVVDVYPGTKQEDFALSEFLIQGAPN